MQVVDNPGDFERYYVGSYIAKRVEAPDSWKGDKLQPLYVRSVRTDFAGSAMVELQAVGKRKVYTEPFKTVMDEYKITCPRLGAISTNATVVHVSLLPLRQYKKGLSEDRVNIYYFSNIIPKYTFFDLVEYIYNPVYFQPKELLKLMEEGVRIGGAITQNLSIFAARTARYPVLAYKSLIIGEVEENTVKLLKAFAPHQEYITKKMDGFDVKIWGS